MKNLGTIVGAAAFVAAIGFAGTAQADPYADEAISLSRVTPGLASNGLTVLNTSADDGDNGVDSTGAPDWPPGGAVRVNKITSLGFDENGTVLTTDDSGGNVVLGFTDNVCLDGPGADVKLYDAAGEVSDNGNESAMIEVSNNGGVSYTDIGDVVPGGGEAGYELDLSGAIASFNRVRVTAIDWLGQATLAGFDLDAVECLNNFDLGTADIDKFFVLHGDDTSAAADEVKQTSKFGFDDRQFKAFDIEITNNTGVNGGLAGLTFIDVAPAEWDLDTVEENDVNGCVGNAEVCDGVDVIAATGEVTDCTAIGAEGGAKGKSKGNQKLAPEVITITAGGLDDGDTCIVRVWVMTDGEHPGNGPVFTPTSCPVTLNDGVKVLDASFNLMLQDDSSLIFDEGASQADGTGVDGTCIES